MAQIGAAYQVLSNTELRKQYDRFGPEKAVPDSGFGKGIDSTIILTTQLTTPQPILPSSSP